MFLTPLLVFPPNLTHFGTFTKKQKLFKYIFLKVTKEKPGLKEEKQNEKIGRGANYERNGIPNG